MSNNEKFACATSDEDTTAPQTSAIEGIGDATAQDDFDMQRLGRKPQLKRSFHSLSILGLTTMTMISWTGAFSALSFPFINGGRAGAIYDWLAGWALETLVVASLAEMASIAPTSSGQYHWVSEFAPLSIQKPLSYVAGWLAALTWQTYIATPAFAAAQMILILASLNSESYMPTAWQETLLTIAIAIFVFLFNIFCAKSLPATQIIILALLVIGFFGALIPLWVLAPTVPAGEAFGSFSNYGGWSSVGAACVVGQIYGIASITGTDAAAHMAEEVKDASRAVPRAMMATVLLNGLMGFIVALTLSFIIQSVKKQVVDSTAVYPFIDIFEVSVGSRAGAIGMTVPIVVLSVFCSVSSMATASRQAWAFARDGGFPFSSHLAKVTIVNSTPLPVNAMLASLGITFIIALLNLGGTEVFDSVFGLGSGAASTTYVIGIGSMLWRRLFGKPLPPARWSLGRLGLPVNCIAFLFLIEYVPLAYFPVFQNVTAKTMNWGVAMFGGAALFSIGFYLVRGRKTYKGPVVLVKAS